MLFYQSRDRSHQSTIHPCGLHGLACYNKKVKQPRSTELNVKGENEKLTYKTTDEQLKISAKSDCEIEAIFALMSLTRRHPDKYYQEFYSHLHDNIWVLLYRSSERVLMSILDTIIDSGGHRGDTALLGMTIFREWQIALSVQIPKTIEQYGPSRIWKTTKPVYPQTIDTVSNHYQRVAKNLRTEPIVWLLFYQIYKIVIRSKNIPVIVLDQLIKAPKFDGFINAKNSYLGVEEVVKKDIFNEITDILRPTTISPKHAALYSEVHAKSSIYGSGRKLSRSVLQLLKEWGAYKVLDFGCGKGNLNFPGLISYDPVTHPNLPDGPFDAIISLDVMEHIPIDELPIICEWFSLWSKRLYLEICTRVARQILPNGENAHCIVQDHIWWATTLQKHLPQYKVEILSYNISKPNTKLTKAGDHVNIVCLHESLIEQRSL